MPEQFTSEDYAWALAEIGCYLRPDYGDGKHRRMAGIVAAALRIASNVARPGLIEPVVKRLSVCDDPSCTCEFRMATAIRKAVGAAND